MHRALIAACFIVAFFAVSAQQPARAAPLDCTIASSGFFFGSYDVFNATDAMVVLSNAVQYTCNKNSTAVTITLGPSSGTNFYTPRQMLQRGADPLLYYVSLGGFTPLCGGGSGLLWGDFLLNNNTVSYIAVSGPRNVPNYVPAYGCIPHGQNVAGGLHTDSLTVTILF